MLFFHHRPSSGEQTKPITTNDNNNNNNYYYFILALLANMKEEKSVELVRKVATTSQLRCTLCGCDSRVHKPQPAAAKAGKLLVVVQEATLRALHATNLAKVSNLWLANDDR